MTGHVVDASVVVKWLVTEKFSDEAANALWALRRRGDISGDDMAAAVDALKAAPPSRTRD